MAAGSFASAETTVSGTSDAVRLEASNATLDEILSALGGRFGLAYQKAAPLDRRIDGIYEGQIASVLKRLLKSHDFVLRSENESLSLLVIGERRSAAHTRSQLALGSTNAGQSDQAQSVPPRAAAAAVKSALQSRLDVSVSSRTSSSTTRPAAPASAAPPSAAGIAELIQRSSGTLQSLRQSLTYVQPKL